MKSRSGWTTTVATVTALSLAACATVPPDPSRSPLGDVPAWRLRAFDTAGAEGERERERLAPQRLSAPPAEMPVSDALGNWMQVGPLNLGGKVFSLSASRQDVGVLYAAYGDGGVWKTSDNGANWLQISNRFTRNQWTLVEVHPLDDDIVLIAGGSGVYPEWPEQAGVHLSRDGGRTFRDITPAAIDPLRHFFDRAEFDPASPGTIYLTTYAGLYKSIDWGETWRNMLPTPMTASWNTIHDLLEVALMPGNGSVVLAQRQGIGMMRSTDGGETWTRVGTDAFLDRLGNSRIAFAESNPQRVYVLTWPGNLQKPSLTYAYRSDDGGITWNEHTGTVVEAPYFLQPDGKLAYGSGTRGVQMNIDVDPQNPDHVIAVTSSYFTSTDGFRSRDYTADYDIAVDFLGLEISRADPRVVFVGSDQGVFRLTAGGRHDTMRRFDTGVYTPHAFHFTVSDDGRTRRMYASFGHYGGPLSGDLDAPPERRKWLDPGLVAEYVPVAASPLDARLVFSGGFSSPLVRTTTRGRAFEAFEFVDPVYGPKEDGWHPRPHDDTPWIAFHPTQRNVVVTNAARQMWLSREQGARDSWTPIGPPAELDAGYLGRPAFSPADPDLLYTSDPHGRILVHRFSTGTWTTVTPMRDGAREYAAFPTPSPTVADEVYFGGSDVLRCRDFGRVCEPLSLPTTLEGQPRATRIVFDDTNPDRLYVTTPIGIATRLLSRDGWTVIGSQWTRVAPTDLEVRRGRVYASSKRGIFELVRDFDVRFPAPTDVTAQALSRDAVALAWRAAPDARGYQVFRGNALVHTVMRGDATTVSVPAIGVGEACWRVASFNGDNDMSALSAPACAVGGGGDYRIGADTSGVFFDPAQGGQGFVVHVMPSDDGVGVLAAWYTFRDGAPVWLVGRGTVDGGRATIPLVITRGGAFPPAFDPASVVQEPWGELVLDFADADRAQATWTTIAPGFTDGTMPLTRLAGPGPADAIAPTGALSSCHGGVWYDAARGGHGLMVEVDGSGANRQLLVAWYVYAAGEQRWLIGTGPIVGDTATVAMNIASGGDFPPRFDPTTVRTEPWGTLRFRAIDRDRAAISWTSAHPGFADGTLSLSRLSSLAGHACP